MHPFLLINFILMFFLHLFREVCKNEFIIPLGPELKELYNDEEMRHSLRSLETQSVRPQLRMTEIVYVFSLETIEIAFI